MVIWFAACSVVLVAVVFQSPGIDYRWVIAGSVAPLLEQVTGGPKVLHSVIGAMTLLLFVVAATSKRRLVRRRVLGFPIGVMAHLVLDGSFTQTRAFWWPVTGLSFAPGPVPEIDHLALSLVLELVGIGVGVWAWRRFGLADPGRRARFLADGRLDLPT